MKRDYLTLGDVLALHADQIATYGGAGGIRDPGQLDAALPHVAVAAGTTLPADTLS